MSTHIKDDVHKVVSREVGRRVSGMLPSHDRKKAAGAIGVRYETLRRWCVGDIVPSSVHLPALAEYLGVDIMWILLGISAEKEDEREREGEKPPPDKSVSQLLECYEKITKTNISLIQHLENTIAANVKDNDAMRIKIQELKRSISDCKERIGRGKRKGDPKGFDPVKLRSI